VYAFKVTDEKLANWMIETVRMKLANLLRMPPEINIKKDVVAFFVNAWRYTWW
jgi:hypothetical protein